MNLFKRLNWTNTLFLTLSPIVAVLGLWLYLYLETFSWSMVALFLAFYLATGFSITAGYHRLIAHRAYKVHPLVKLFYLIFGAAAFQNSAKKWCQDHRVHHRKVDTEEDPYNAKRGFWYSHIGWIFFEENRHMKFDADLEKDPLIEWQHKYYMLIAILAGIALPMFIGHILGSSLGGFVFGAALRIVFTHHCTFFINSLAHIWGSQPYNTKNTAKDNMVLAFFTYGEGYHNFHHKFEADYRNGIYWYQFDPTKWLIQGLNRIGLADKLLRVPEEEILKAKMRSKNQVLLDNYSAKIKAEYLEKLEALRLKVETSQKNFRKMKKDYAKMKKDFATSGKEKLDEMKLNYRLAKSDFQAAYFEWKKYSRTITAYA